MDVNISFLVPISTSVVFLEHAGVFRQRVNTEEVPDMHIPNQCKELSQIHHLEGLHVPMILCKELLKRGQKR
jgi:hypothetical protein